MKNYKLTHILEAPRNELNEQLNLTGAEVSINNLPEKTNVPFIHHHTQNEEIYGILEGNGHVIIDGEKVELRAGDWLKIAPSAKRQFFASDDNNIKYICIQVKENSLETFTMTDAIID